MKQHTFEQSHQQQWNTLERWLDKIAQQKPIGQEITQLPQLYRQVCQHLALARDRHYTPHLIARLNRLVLRGHQCLYQTPIRLFSQIINFIRSYFPQQVRQEWRLVSLASLLFFGSAGIVFVGIQNHPDLIYSVLTAAQVHEIEAMYDPQKERWGYNREAESDFLMFGYYIRNNISIDFQAFAGGILFGLGSLFFLLFNGIYLGCVAGHLTHMGYGVPFYAFIAGHSALELMALVLAGAAGLNLGMALIAPGRLTRLQALRCAATDSIRLIYGVAGMTLLAAVIEAFWSSNAAIEPLIKYIVGNLFWLILMSYFLLAGRYRAT
ncbi:integral membrane protein [Thioploca ingrica]|uniref:Integral membrane protein n=1 Tax=Thioploca ingrica TaxID=40754 RepID=A0A090BVN2_9GAMM|nr:integral membrane protein [Thioploca ingrica]